MSRIIQNFDKIQYKDPRVALVDNFVKRSMGSFLVSSTVLYHDYGANGFENEIYDYLAFINSVESETAMRMKNSLLIKCEVANIDLSGINPGLFTYKAKNNMIMLGYRTDKQIIYGELPDELWCGGTKE